MGEKTGIAWTDSTHNPWHGCTAVGPACDHCYAEAVDKRGGGGHWGHGAPRKLLSEHARNEPYRWNRNADKFFAKHGRRQRVFTLSMGDLFDNEVPQEWRTEHILTMERCDSLEWQICTKRVSNIGKMVPAVWWKEIGGRWPQHIGVLVTIVTQAEADRDVPRLLELKRRAGIPWVGISYEPAQEFVDWTKIAAPGVTPVGHKGGRRVSVGDLTVGLYDEIQAGRSDLLPCFNALGGDLERKLEYESLDWIIFGGKSGGKWNDRPFSLDWAYKTRDACAETDTPFFMKQVAAFRPTDAMIPEDLMIRQWPRGH